jgi:hypothetical protein
VTVTTRGSNPIIKLPTPITTTDTAGENVIIINIGFINISYDLSFQLTDGPGSFNFETMSGSSTNFEKIMYLFGGPGSESKDPKILTLNGSDKHGQIESVNIPWKAGMKNLTTNGMLSFNVCKDITMGS